MAAVHSGADGVYLGLAQLNARMYAPNFDLPALRRAVAFCHRFGVAVYLACNTLIFSSELEEALTLLLEAAALGIDGVILQDLGLARLVREAVPALPLHASTQMTVHTPEGVRFLKEQGFVRVVVARELRKEQIAALCGLGVEIECFVHGALCYAVSGGCYFSSVLGGRSANRGRCAQPCRLPFRVRGQRGYPLSYKDICLVEHLDALREMGVSSLKIEGRMKRPEYAAEAVAVYRAALDGKTYRTDRLQKVFSRSGFTDGYFTGRCDSSLLGVRRRQDVTAATPALLKEIRAGFARPLPRVTLEGKVVVRAGEVVRFFLSDACHQVVVTGSTPEPAQREALTQERVRAALQKLGGTPYRLTQLQVLLEPNLYLSAASLNQLRRRAVEALDEKRGQARPIPSAPQRARDALQGWMQKVKPVRWRWMVLFARPEQVCFPEQFDYMGLPADRLLNDWPRLAAWREKWMAVLPDFDPREDYWEKSCRRLRACGVEHLYAQNLAAVRIGRELGFRVHAGHSLHIGNPAAVWALLAAGAQDAILSPELHKSDLYALPLSLPVGLPVYGHLPLMTAQNCPVALQCGCGDCKGQTALIDRMGKSLPIRCQRGIATLYNPIPLYLGDRLDELPAQYGRLALCTLESGREARRALECLLRGGRWEGERTTGWWARPEQTTRKEEWERMLKK